MMITIYHFYLYPQKFFLGIHTDWNRIKWLLFSSSNERPYKLHSGTIKQHIDYNKTKLNKGNPSLISFTDLGVSTWMETRLKVAFLEIRGVGGGEQTCMKPWIPPAPSNLYILILLWLKPSCLFVLKLSFCNCKNMKWCCKIFPLFWFLTAWESLFLTSVLFPSTQSLPLQSHVLNA